MFKKFKNFVHQFGSDTYASTDYIEMGLMLAVGLGMIALIRYLINTMGASGVSIPEQISWIFPALIIGLVIVLGYAIYTRYYK